MKKKEEGILKKIEETKAKLEEKQLPVKKLMEEYKKAKREITNESLKPVYTFLQKNSNNSVSFLFEGLIGIMRNVKLSDPASVEIYLKNL